MKNIETNVFSLFFMMQRHGKNNKCFLCDQQTLGVFNTAVEIKKKIAQVREKAKGL